MNQLRGLHQTAPINVSLDSRYNSQTIAGTYKQGTNASQAVGLAIECQTDSRDIIGLYTENKLCWVGASLRNKGYDVECPDGHTNCTSAIAPEDPISEYNIGKQLGRQMTGQSVFVKHAVTDGDARSAQGLEAGIAEKYPTWKCSGNLTLHTYVLVNSDTPLKHTSHNACSLDRLLSSARTNRRYLVSM